VGKNYSYEPGDILCVLPANLPDAVDEFLAAAQLDGNRVIARITPNRAGTPPRQDLILFAAHFDKLTARRHAVP
jgi:sulfite reductase alpha subunit-like flavoprotein